MTRKVKVVEANIFYTDGESVKKETATILKTRGIKAREEEAKRAMKEVTGANVNILKVVELNEKEISCTLADDKFFETVKEFGSMKEVEEVEGGKEE